MYEIGITMVSCFLMLFAAKSLQIVCDFAVSVCVLLLFLYHFKQRIFFMRLGVLHLLLQMILFYHSVYLLS